jgi:peroxiredoxin
VELRYEIPNKDILSGPKEWKFIYKIVIRRRPGEKIKGITLPAIDGTTFETESIKGKPFMLSFLRFASCPFCNLRVNELVRRFDEFGD